MGYYKIEPFGDDIHLIGHGITASTIANVNRKKGAKAFEAKDFVPKFRKEQQTTEGMLQFAEMMTIAHGGSDLRED